MREIDLGWPVSHVEMKDVERVRVNGKWFYAKRQWMPTSMSFYTEADISLTRNVFLNGQRFVRAMDRDFDIPDALE